MSERNDASNLPPERMTARRLVAADIIGQQHEAVMAALTRTAQTASSTTEAGVGATGDLKGMVYLKSHEMVRGQDEGWAAYLGRMEQELGDILTLHTKLNADKLRRDLEASVG